IKRRAVSLVGEARVDRTVEHDAVPCQLAVRFDKVPKARARLGVGGPRLPSPAGATGRGVGTSEFAGLVNATPPPPTWTIVTWKMSVARHIPPLGGRFRSSGVGATVSYTELTTILGFLPLSLPANQTQ